MIMEWERGMVRTVKEHISTTLFRMSPPLRCNIVSRIAPVSPLVLPNTLQVATTDNNGTLHLGRHNDTLQNEFANRNIAGEWALFVDVGAFDSSLRGLEAEADVLGPASLLDGLLADNILVADEEENCCGMRRKVLVIKRQDGWWWQ